MPIGAAQLTYLLIKGENIMSNNLTLRSVDFAPLHRALIGFDQLFDNFENRYQNSTTNYPPHNVVKIGENQYEIQLAVAGFSKQEVTVEIDQDQLVIKGNKHEDDASIQYLYRGLAFRNFVRSFTLADHVEVRDAEHKDGVLTIKLERVIPESLKPRQILIK